MKQSTKKDVDKSSRQDGDRSKLALKVLFMSYIKNHSTLSTILDCHNAINNTINHLNQQVQSNYQQISSIVNDDHNQNNKQSLNPMETIYQEDYTNTQRSNQLQQTSIDKLNQNLISKFNRSINILQITSHKFQSIMFMYKNQIKQIAKDLTKQKQLNKKISKQLQFISSKSNQQVKSIQQTNSNEFKQLKQNQNKQTKQSSLNKLSKSLSNQINSLHKPATSLSKPSSSLSKGNTLSKQVNINKNSKRNEKQQQQQDQMIRCPPKPFCQQCLQRQKQNYLRQKQLTQQRNKWKQLSIKITNLKEQLCRYQQQLIGKQSQINKLSEQLKTKNEQQCKIQSEQKKKLRSMNTTLRGQKIVLQNQILNMKKRLQSNQELIDNYQSQNKKLSLQKDNLQSTIKWHINTIQDLRSNYSIGIKQQGQYIHRYKQQHKRSLQLQQTIKILQQQINQQQQLLLQFVSKLQLIQNIHTQSITKLNTQIQQLQTIIQQKNQTIIKLKINNQNSSLLSNLNQPNLNQYHSKLIYYNNNTIPHNDHSTNKQSAAISKPNSIQKRDQIHKRDHTISGTIFNKTLKKQQCLSSNPSNNQGFQQNMIKILNKKLVDKQSAIQKLIRQNQILKAQLQVYKQNQ